MNNKNNKIISKKDVLFILNREKQNSKIEIFELKWYQRAFACQCFYDQLKAEKSSLIKKDMIFEKSNETLEIVGDSIIGAIIVEYLEERFSEEREGFISLMKMHITKTEGLCNLAKILNFSEWVLLSNENESLITKNELDEEEITGRKNPEFLENCFEAFMGALFTDYKNKFNVGKAYEICRDFLVSLIEEYIDFSSLILKGDNYKNLLQHYFHKRKWPLPVYEDLKTETDEMERMIYSRVVYIERFLLTDSEIYELINHFSGNQSLFIGSKIMLGLGISYKKKNADQLCAKSILELFCPESLELDIEMF